MSVVAGERYILSRRWSRCPGERLPPRPQACRTTSFMWAKMLRDGAHGCKDMQTDRAVVSPERADVDESILELKWAPRACYLLCGRQKHDLSDVLLA
jgi:hypothetical protein